MATKKVKKQQEKIVEKRNGFDHFFEKREKLFFNISIGFAILFSILLFDFKVSVGGDDSAYISRAYNFLHSFRYPTFQAPLYPMVLSIFVGIVGIKIPLLKAFSLICMIGHLILLYKACKGKFSSSILIPALLIVSINSYLLYYGSQTYSEAFFVFLQSWVLLVIFRRIIPLTEKPFVWKEMYKDFLFLGFAIFILSLCRSIGSAAIISLVLFFAIFKKWKHLFASLGSFIGFTAIFEVIKRILWTTKEIGKSQGAILFQKEGYYPEKGAAELADFWQRFLDNSQYYLSKYLFVLFGFKEPLGKISVGLTIFAYLIFILALVYAFRKNRYLLYIGLYLTVVFGVTFVGMHKVWIQGRLIYGFYQLIAIFLLSGFYYFVKDFLPKIKLAYIIIPAVIFIATIQVTGKKVKEHQPIFKENISGNLLSGFSLDWKNYIEMTKWAAKKLPAEEVIACRKPNIAFIYGERKFHGIYRLPSQNPDTIMNYLKKREIHYVIMANLRKYEKRKTQYTINTIKRMLYFLQQKYPNSLQKIHEIGNDEKATLIKINY